jgi:signal transduction histidine kinase
MKHNIEPDSTSQSIGKLSYAVPVHVLQIDGSSHHLPLLRDTSKWDSLEPFQITRKRTLAEGLEALRSSLFRIVLLDISVATVPEIESLTEILGNAKGVPVIVLVNEGSGLTNGAEAVRRGAEGYVLKGCKSESLLYTLSHTMERQSLMAAIEDAKKSIACESHDLRNALACIHQFGNILLDGLAGPISDDQREYVGIMLQNASRIRAIVDNLRDPEEFVADSIPSNIGAN